MQVPDLRVSDTALPFDSRLRWVVVAESERLFVHFYDVRGLLVRVRSAARQSSSAEVWDGYDWVPNRHIDALLSYGYHLTEARALVLMHEVRDRNGLTPLSDRDALIALRAPGKHLADSETAQS